MLQLYPQTIRKSACCLIISTIYSLTFITGCNSEQSETDSAREAAFESIQPSVDSQEVAEEDRVLSADEMREALGANETARFEKTGRKFVMALLTNSGAKTLEPLAGQPLKVLDISQTHITDLSPLKGMSLDNLGMAETKVSDLSPLKGMSLKHIDGTRSLVEDISVLAGMRELTHAYFEGAKVKDISPLQNSPLQVLWLNGCPIEDLSPLNNKQLEQLNLCDTPLQNLDTVKTMQLGTLWMRNTAVRELGPIANHGLVSLDVQGSAVDNLDALASMSSLKRLNIAETEVTDLSPLAGLELERIIFNPEKITTGIEAIRGMTSLKAIDTSFEGNDRPMSPPEFWERYDAGEYKPTKE